MNPKHSLIPLLNRSWSDWKLKLVSLLTSRSGLQNLISAAVFLLMLFVAYEEFRRLNDFYSEVFRRAVKRPGSLLDRRRVSGCAFNREIPGWDDLLGEASKRIPDSERVLMLPVGPDPPGQHSAHCLLAYELFPRQIIRVYPGKKEQLGRDYLTSIAESRRARYFILYGADKNYDPPFAHCRFGEGLLLVDVKNEISCKPDVN
ncbi:MAG: hypothetical protein AB7U82_15750 [Blastocatellales bacterium]